MLTNEVLDFTIDDLIIVEQIIPSDKRRALIEAIKTFDGLIPLHSNKDIMSKTGLDVDQVKNLKRHKEWIQKNFWFYVDDAGMFRFQAATNHINRPMPTASNGSA